MTAYSICLALAGFFLGLAFAISLYLIFFRAGGSNRSDNDDKNLKRR